jgi:hypothetical protein
MQIFVFPDTKTGDPLENGQKKIRGERVVVKIRERDLLMR